jgi:hypothetical protein
MVVPEYRGLQLSRIGQVGTPGAEIETGRDGRVINIVRVCHAVTIAIDAPDAPAGRDELHRSDRAVPDSVAIQHSVVGIGDGSDTW